MKLPTKIIAAAAATLALCAQANAALLFNGPYNNAGSNSYVGNYNATAEDQAIFFNGVLSNGNFTNTWVFNFGPIGLATMNASFRPGFPDPNGILNFQISLYTATASGGCTAATLTTPGTCTGLSLGSLVSNGVNLGSSSNIGFTPLTAGLYAFVVTGNVVASTNSLYSGQLQTSPVPEPASLALVGAALCGMGFSLRKRKAA